MRMKKRVKGRLKKMRKQPMVAVVEVVSPAPKKASPKKPASEVTPEVAPKSVAPPEEKKKRPLKKGERKEG